MSERQWKAMSYTRRAAWRFLQGLRYRSPDEAVAAGVRTAEEWCEVLNEERAAAGLEEHRPLVVRSLPLGFAA